MMGLYIMEGIICSSTNFKDIFFSHKGLQRDFHATHIYTYSIGLQLSSFSVDFCFTSQPHILLSLYILFVHDLHYKNVK